MATNPTIQFKRKTSAAGAPASLSAGEPAFNTVENFLYVGNGSAVKWVGAEILDHTTTAFTSTTSLATRKAIGDIFAPLRSPVFTGTITGSALSLSESTDTLLVGSTNDGGVINFGTGPGTVLKITGSLTTGSAVSNIKVGNVTSPGFSTFPSLVLTGAMDPGASGGQVAQITISGSASGVSQPSLVNIDAQETLLSGDLVVKGGDITSTATTFNLLNTTVTSGNVLGAASLLVLGAFGAGTVHSRTATFMLGGTGNTIIRTITGSSNSLSIAPQGNLILAPSSSVGGLGTTGSLTVQNGSIGGATSISGAPLLLGDYTDSGGSSQPGELRILESGGSNYTGFKAQAMSANYIYTLPSAFPGSSGYVLQSDTSGNMSWAAPASSSSVGVTATSASTNYKMVFTNVNASNTSAALFIDTTSGIVFNPSANNLTVAGSVYANASLYLGATTTGVNRIYIPETDPTGGFAVNELANDIDHIYLEKQNPGVTPLGPFNNVYYMKIGDAATYGGYDAFPVGQPINITDYESNVSSFVNIGAGGYLAATNTGYSYYKTINIGPDTGTGKTTYINLGAVNGTSSNLTTVYGAMSVTGNISTNQNFVVNGGTVTSTATTFNLLNTTVTNANVLGDLRTLSIGNNTTTGQVVNMFTNAAGTSTYNFATGNTANGSTKTINIGQNSGAGVTNVNIGGGLSGKTLIESSIIDLNSATISSNATVLSLFATNLTVQAFHNAQTLSLGATTGNATIRNANTNINGTLTVTGVSVHQGAGAFNSTLSVTGAATFVDDIAVNGGDITSTATTFNLLNTTVTGLNIGGGANTVNIGSTTAVINLGTGTTGATVNVKGNLVVDGSTTTVNSTTVTIDDLNIVLADGQTTAAGVDGAGISLGTSGITWNYVHGGGTFANWTSTENLDLTTGKSYKIGNQSVLSSSTLGPSVVTSSLTQVGTIATGTWRGSVIAANWGGTGFGTYTVGQLLYADTTTSLAKLTAAATPGSLLASNGAGVAPEYKFISLTNGTVTSSSGTLTLAIQNAAADGSTKGLASFNSTQFDDSSGLITLDTIDGGTYA